MTVTSGGYITLPITIDPNAIQQSALNSIASTIPGWVPRESHIEVLLLEQFAAMTAESANVAAQVPLSIFAYFGTLVGITPEQGSVSTALSTWTMTNNAGYTVPAGTQVNYQVLGNQSYTFQTVDDFTVPNGSTTATDVLIEATSVGTYANGLTTQPIVLTTALSYVASIASTTTTSGGSNIETTSAYLDRLSNELRLLTPRPILPSDFAVLATTIPGVARAAAFNLVNPFANILSTEDATFSGGLGSWQPQSIGRQITGASVTSGSTTLTGTGFVSTDTHRQVTMPGVPPGTTVTYVNSTTLTLSQDATTTGSSLTGTLGGIVSTAGATLTNTVGAGGENTLKITATGTGDAVAGTFTGTTTAFPAYTANAGAEYIAMVSLDEPSSTTPPVTIRLAFYDTNQDFLSVFVSNSVTTSASGYSFVYVTGEAPALAQYLSLSVDVASPSASVAEYVAWACVNEILTAPTNVVPDSSLLNVATTGSWALTSGMVQTIFQSGIYSAQYTGTGSASGTRTATSQFFYLPAGTYTFSTYMDCSNTSTGTPEALVKYGATTAITLTQSLGVAGTVSGSFTLGSAEMVYVVFTTNNCTVANGLTLTFAQPSLSSTEQVYSPGPTYSGPNQIDNNERMVTVACVDANGEALNTTVEDQVSAYLESEREVNFIVNVIAPTFNVIDVTWSAICYNDTIPATVLAAGNTAINNYLDPANWGSDTSYPEDWDPDSSTLRILSLITVLGNVPGIDYLTGVNIGFHNATLARTDLPLLGYAPLTTPGSINGVVTADPVVGS